MIAKIYKAKKEYNKEPGVLCVEKNFYAEKGSKKQKCYHFKKIPNFQREYKQAIKE